jgi:single-stranded DNA-binding protein
MDYKIKGKVVSVGETKEFGSNGFRKREVVIDTTKNEAYPSPVPVTFKKDDCDRADTLNVGDVVSVEGFLEGRKWDGPNGVRYFVDVVAKSVMVEQKSATAANAEDPASVKDWDTLLAFAKAHGMAKKEDVQKVCKDYTTKHGIVYAKMTAKDWTALAGAVLDILKAEDAAATAAAQDGMPF